MQKIDFRNDLNEEQYAAATAPDGPLLVLAAAGTGKTRTLVYRVAYLVESGISPDRILLLTFTNKAAREMLERANQVVGAGVGGIWAGTFHHMANRILRRYAGLIGFGSDFTILDRDDSRTIVLNCVKDLGFRGKEFPKSDVLLGLFSAAANTETSIEDIMDQRFTENHVDPEQVVKVHGAYNNKKRKLGAMDFDDLLTNCLSLFREKKEVVQKYQEQFLHILVDEYQDTNTIQAELIDRLAEKNRNLLVVGDDFQSIYSWRGANFRNIMSFPERYKDSRMYKLETNYRSVPEILAVANACIAGNPEQFQKTLRPTREPYKKPIVFKMRDGGEQARHVVEQISSLQCSGYKLSDIAILYRAHYHAMELQMVLTRERIPYVITSGTRFFEQAHIKDVCSVLRILETPGDEMAFTRLIGFLPGVGAATAAKLWQKLGGSFKACDPGSRKRLRQALRPAALEGWDAISAVFEAYDSDDLKDDGGEVIHRFVESFYERYCANAYQDPGRRIDDIRELILYMARFETVEMFLSDVALLTNFDAETESLDSSGKDALRLSTVHQAKGLEWPVVIMLWVTDGMFPSARSMNESAGGEAEERRLFYVAVTRAKDELCMYIPEIRRKHDGSVIYCLPSRFVEEIPADIMEEVYKGFI